MEIRGGKMIKATLYNLGHLKKTKNKKKERKRIMILKWVLCDLLELDKWDGWNV